MAEMKHELLTTEEVARLLRVRPTTLRRQAREGTAPVKPIKVGKLWRFRAADVNALLGATDTAA